ncbi:Hypp5174 [Branchiostoma lanceolatum]|uniref:Hypp5174 protein n=1 Tax=Branchiostoma lanceolatum TaxID=7740 RepID=A0A8K0F0M9_BRALA|nr:Hypp5174 [Branchiostoma lanceolatum]
MMKVVGENAGNIGCIARSVKTIQLARREADEEEDDGEQLGRLSRTRRGNKERKERKKCKKVINCVRNEFRQNITQEVRKMLARNYVHRFHPEDVEGPGSRRNVQEFETVLSVKVASRDNTGRSWDERATTIQGGGVYLVYGQLTYNKKIGRQSYNGQSILVISDDNNRSEDRFLTCVQQYPDPVDTNAIPTSCFTAGVVPLQEGMMINLTASVMGQVFIDRDKTFLGAVNLAELPPEPSDGG